MQNGMQPTRRRIARPSSKRSEMKADCNELEEAIAAQSVARSRWEVRRKACGVVRILGDHTLIVPTDKKRNANRGPSAFGSGSGSRAVRVKNEGEGYGGGSGSYSGGGRPSLKREDGDDVSSEEDDDAEFPRRDIDLIEVSSDENEDKDAVAQSRRGARTTLPVRIGRKEHQERTVALNTDASSETAAKLVEKAEATGETAAKSLSGPASLNKGKGKAKDVEITGATKPFRGVWQDEDDAGLTVKVEAISDDEAMADAEPAGLGEQPPHAAEKQEPASPHAERKPKMRTQSAAEPILQTDEDRAEWARFQSNLQSIRAELGPEEAPPAVDASGDSSMAEGAAATKKTTVRDNNVYLFQIPPLMPELLSPCVPGEAADGPSSTAVAAPAVPAAPSARVAPSRKDGKVKLEEGTFSDPSAPTNDAPRFASGMVGKLRVRQSGRTTLDWGGTSYELMPGNKASFLQEVVSMQLVPEAKRVVPEDAGDAISMGRVKGKFVVVPDWADMLGG